MNKIYKGWELLKAIADGEIKEGTRVKAPNNIIYSYNNFGFKDCEDEFMNENFSDKEYATLDFELISEPTEEIDIQNIEEVEDDAIFSATYVKDKINQLIKAIKQLDNQIKEKE